MLKMIKIYIFVLYSGERAPLWLVDTVMLNANVSTGEAIHRRWQIYSAIFHTLKVTLISKIVIQLKNRLFIIISTDKQQSGFGRQGQPSPRADRLHSPRNSGRQRRKCKWLPDNDNICLHAYSKDIYFCWWSTAATLKFCRGLFEDTVQQSAVLGDRRMKKYRSGKIPC